MSRRAALRIGLVVVASLGLAMCSMMWRTDEIKYSHQNHLLVEGLKCSSCHVAMDTVTDLSEPHLPKEQRCLLCHTEEKDDCSFCHLNPEAPTTLTSHPTRGLIFDHSAHIKRVKAQGGEDVEGCQGCHQDAILGGDVDSSRGPGMFDECMGCHRQDFREIDCLKCHEDFYQDQLAPRTAFDHRGDFITRHGDLAKGDMMVCSHCHQESSCAQCHSKMAPAVATVLRSDEPQRWRMHEGAWLTKHAIEARTGSSECMTCHTPDRCTSCHQDHVVAAMGGPGLGPHPAGWLINDSSDFHGEAARRNIATCATCHDRGPDTNCINCHSPGAVGGTPHPPGWSTRIDREEGQACIWCHK